MAAAEMKDFLIGIAVTAVFIVVFSGFVPFFPSQSAEGIYPTLPGDRGMPLPGGGEGFAELVPELSERDLCEQTVHDAEEKSEQRELNRGKEQGNNMNDIIVAFWHGVAAVLIGEACALALMLASAWQKRK